ncbi:MAG: ATP-dependent helicase [Chloroflexi bacterium]|nr:ATP-dependent helicase [Chloroflexota bacterium]
MSEYLERLAKIEENAEQFKALRTDKSCVVIAGPGSGKTYLLTAKIAKFLYERIYPPQGIACITYSRLLARQLHTEIHKIGIQNSSRLFIGTVHSFCLKEIIHPYKQFCGFDLPEPLRIASKDERREAIRGALLEQKIIRRDIDNVAKNLDKYRRRYPYCDPIIKESIEWSRLANRYIQLLLSGTEPSVDFVYLEILALYAIEKHKSIRDILEAKFPFLAIDEYQDLNYPFHRMVTSLLSCTNVKVFAIGDRDQCIYEQLQGTNPQYLTELAEQVKTRDNNEPITLRQNYRSADELIRISEIVLGENRGYQSNAKDGLFVCVNCSGGEQGQFHVLLESVAELGT